MNSSFTNSPLLETIICLVLVYALLSLMVSSVTEIINSYFNERGEMLYNSISRLFDDGFNVNFGQMLYSHPQIKNLRKNMNSLPQYISNTMFSQALIDVVGNYARVYVFDENFRAIIPGEGTTDPFERFVLGVHKMGNTGLKILLLNMTEKSVSLSGTDPSKKIGYLDSQLQQWYKDQMDRTSGWFKDLMGARIRWSAFIIAVLLNVNSIYLFKSLFGDSRLRSKIIPVAEQMASVYEKQLADTSLFAYQKGMRAVALSEFKKGSADSSFKKLDSALSRIQKIDSLADRHDSARIKDFQNTILLLDDLKALDIPIGWHDEIPPLRLWQQSGFLNIAGQVFWYLVGIAITVFAISAGAPFWFQVLLKLVNVRKAGKKPEA